VHFCRAIQKAFRRARQEGPAPLQQQWPPLRSRASAPYPAPAFPSRRLPPRCPLLSCTHQALSHQMTARARDSVQTLSSYRDLGTPGNGPAITIPTAWRQCIVGHCTNWRGAAHRPANSSSRGQAAPRASPAGPSRAFPAACLGVTEDCGASRAARGQVLRAGVEPASSRPRPVAARRPRTRPLVAAIGEGRCVIASVGAPRSDRTRRAARAGSCSAFSSRKSDARKSALLGDPLLEPKDVGAARSMRPSAATEVKWSAERGSKG
jgi:hypothetical protein